AGDGGRGHGDADAAARRRGQGERLGAEGAGRVPGADGNGVGADAHGDVGVAGRGAVDVNVPAGHPRRVAAGGEVVRGRRGDDVVGGRHRRVVSWRAD